MDNTQITLTQPLEIENGGTLALNPDAKITLEDVAIIVADGGSLTRYSSSEIEPDIRLYDGSTLKGQYPASIDAFADAASGDEVEIHTEDY